MPNKNPKHKSKKKKFRGNRVKVSEFILERLISNLGGNAQFAEEKEK